ncbi:Mbeg1-like protein, partial [Ruminococcus sp.]
FSGNLLQSPQYLRLKERVHTYVPQASIVGMLLEHEEEYQVVYSNQKGFLQHDPYSWCVMRNDWYYLDHITEASQLLDVSLKKWILGMTPEERKRLTGGIFHVLQSGTDAKTVEDLRSGKDTLSGILQGWKDTDPETRRFMQQMVLELILTVRDYAALHHQKSPEDILQSVRRRRKS